MTKSGWLFGVLLALLALPRCRGEEPPTEVPREPPSSEERSEPGDGGGAEPTAPDAQTPLPPPDSGSPAPPPDAGTPPPVDAGTPPAADAGWDEVGSRELCTHDGWCRLNPQMNGLRSVWSVNAHQAFAVGPAEHVVHWHDGTARFVPSHTPRQLTRVWAASATEAWAVGELGTIIHWDGIRWSPELRAPVTTDYLEVLFGTGPADVWAAGGSTLLHWDGYTWTRMESPSRWRITALWSSGPGSLWLAASAEGGVHHFGGVHHWNGSTWRQVGDFKQTVEALWGFGPEDVWMGGSKGLLGHWEGTAWRLVPGLDSDTDAPRILSLWGRSSEDLWLAGPGIQHWDGQVLTTEVQGSLWSFSFQAITGGAEGPWLGINEPGQLLRHEGQGRWAFAPPGPTGPGIRVFDGWASGPDNLWIVGGSSVPRYWDGENWSPLVRSEISLTTVTGTSATDVWAAGQEWGASAYIAHFDGREWTYSVLPTNARPQGSFALNEHAAWVVGGQGAVWRWDGRTWEVAANLERSELLAVHASSPENVWAAGYSSALFQWNGRQWVDHGARFTNSTTFTSVWAFGPEDVWVASDHRGLFHWDGQSFRSYGVGLVKDLYGTSPDDLWAVGRYGLVAHWNGQRWSSEFSGVDDDLELITGARGTLFSEGWLTKTLPDGRGRTVGLHRNTGVDTPPAFR